LIHHISLVNIEVNIKIIARSYFIANSFQYHCISEETHQKSHKNGVLEIAETHRLEVKCFLGEQEFICSILLLVSNRNLTSKY